MSRRYPVIVALVLLVAPAAHAWQAPAEEIIIEADASSLDRAAGTAVYQGNVRIVRGNVEIRGDELTFQFDGDELAAAVIRGAPVRFVQRHDGERPPTEAESREVIYDTREGIVRLRGGARVVQGGDEFASDDIRYDTRTERIIAGGEPGSRVQVTIQPRRPPADDERPEPRP